jgi:ABC-type sugar transport system ATPase subunit
VALLVEDDSAIILRVSTTPAQGEGYLHGVSELRALSVHDGRRKHGVLDDAGGAPREEKKKRVGEAANILGLTPLLDRYPRQLSGGQR